MDKLTPEELDAIEARCWQGSSVSQAEKWDTKTWVVVSNETGNRIIETFSESTAILINHHINDIPRLVAALRAAYEEIEEWKIEYAGADAECVSLKIKLDKFNTAKGSYQCPKCLKSYSIIRYANHMERGC